MDKLYIQLAITALYWVVSQVWVKRFCVKAFDPTEHHDRGGYIFHKFAVRLFAPVMMPWFIINRLIYKPVQRSHAKNILFLKAIEKKKRLTDKQRCSLSYSERRIGRSRQEFHEAVLIGCDDNPLGLIMWIIGAIPVAALALVTWGKINWTELASPVFQVVGEFLTKVAQ